jgi:hypothetical protein
MGNLQVDLRTWASTWETVLALAGTTLRTMIHRAGLIFLNDYEATDPLASGPLSWLC